MDYGPNDSIIHFSVYIYQLICATHGIIPNGPSVCISCETNNDINNGLINSPKYGNKKYLTKMSFYIGRFNKVHYQPMLKKYAYHRMLLCLLGKYECTNLINEDFLEDMNAVMTEYDYAEAMKA